MTRRPDTIHECVVVGSGLAGLVAALTLAPMPVVLVTRAALGAESASAWAQGGIAACLGDDDHVDLHDGLNGIRTEDLASARSNSVLQ